MIFVLMLSVTFWEESSLSQMSLLKQHFQCYDQGDSITVESPVENGRRFLTPLVCEGCLLTAWKAAFARTERSRAPPDLLPVAFYPVSRRPAQTSGVRKRLPFSLRIRPEVTPPLERHLGYDTLNIPIPLPIYRTVSVWCGCPSTLPMPMAVVAASRKL